MSRKEEEIQGGEFNLRKFKAGEMQDAVEYPAWMSRVVFGSKVLPTDPCMIGESQPDLIKIFFLQIGVICAISSNISIGIFVGRLKQYGNISRRLTGRLGLT